MQTPWLSILRSLALLGLLTLAACDKKTPQPTPSSPAAKPAAATHAATTVRISGKISLQGTPPPPQPVKMDATCGSLHGTPPMEALYVVGEGGGLAEVFVHIKTGLEGKTFTPPSDIPLLDQQGCTYIPKLLVVWAGQKFNVRNSDGPGILHNVHALPRKNSEFNFGQPLKGQVTQKSFSNPEALIRVKCEVHPWMKSYFAVVNHPFYAVTDANGRFTFPPDLPPGDYTIEAIHPKAGSQSQPLKVAAGEEKNVSLTFTLK